MAGYCPLYDVIARAVADDGDLLALQHSARPHAHLPPMLLAGAHYLLLDGVEHLPMVGGERMRKWAEPWQ